MIEVENLTKIYKKPWFFYQEPTIALNGFNFKACEGKITGLIGHNGAGKTTLFRILAGIEGYDSGSVNINGVDVGNHPEKTRGLVSLLLERHNYINRESLVILIEYGILMGLSLEESRSRALEIVKDMNIDFANKIAASLSRGQLARLGLARMFMVKSKVMIFDEPTVGLDFESAKQIRKFIKDLKSENRVIILSTHILSDIKLLCDDIVGIKKGQNISKSDIDLYMTHE